MSQNAYLEEPADQIKPPAVISPAPIETPVIKNGKLTRKPTAFDWPVAAFMLGVHLVALLGFFTFSWKAFAVCAFFHWITGGLGITLCYHRLLTHRSFQTPKWVEYILAVMGALACQGPPLTWVAVHRLHHAQSDRELDPHSPRHSFFWAHMGWCLHGVNLVSNFEEKQRLAPDLAKDKFYVWMDRYHLLWTVLLALGLYALGGWPFVIWGVFVRMVLVYHATWFVNSAAHVWGYKTYKSEDDSTNLWWVALMTYGEGWHNNHHAFQFSARHGLKWWEFDTTYLTIQILKTFGLATAIKIPSEHLLQTKPLR